MTHLYRAFGADGRLLYVGVSDQFETRILQHANQRALWIPLMRSLSIEYYATRPEALTAEREAIETEWPLWNVDHSIDPDTPRKATRKQMYTSLPIGKPAATPEEFEADFQRTWLEHCRIKDAIRAAEYERLGIRRKPPKFADLVTVV